MNNHTPATVTVPTPQCSLCGNGGALELTEVEADAIQARWPMQDAMPQRSAAEREQMISGTHPQCWESTFGPNPYE